ncbi:MAG: hypothetical protein ABIE55_01480 [Candidatus Aenigmatarchaeota archaeon]
MPNITESIQKEMKSLPTNFVLMVLVDSINYSKVNLGILDYIINKMQVGGVYISVNRPADSMIKTLQEKNINTKKMFFIDCISKTVSGKMERKENILYATSPENLTDIGFAISQIIKSTKSPDYFLFLDSVSTLLIYNSVRSVAKFSHFLINIIRMNNLKGVVMSVEKETDKFVRRTLYVLSDKVINFGGK